MRSKKDIINQAAKKLLEDEMIEGGALSALSEAISQNSASTEQAGDWDTRHAITA
ncbi:MAG: hypothetical protein JRF36_01175 [Deltaproteobacteria bacterium]|jgi:hypothetical protein|nr:hypothetical protein [Deltaproteobacteria bacterium]MBW2518327.1 hypothetical protein [Deltaproteobacteria bacterium]